MHGPRAVLCCSESVTRSVSCACSARSWVRVRRTWRCVPLPLCGNTRGRALTAIALLREVCELRAAADARTVVHGLRMRAHRLRNVVRAHTARVCRARAAAAAATSLLQHLQLLVLALCLLVLVVQLVLRRVWCALWQQSALLPAPMRPP